MCTDRSKLVITPQDSDKPGRVVEGRTRLLTSGFCHGGIMRIGRKYIIPVIVSLSAAGSIFASSAVAVTSVTTATTTVAAGNSTIYYHG